MLRIIINADDLGKSHEVNVAIEDQIKKRNITSTTIMANADGFDEAIKIAKQYPYISYGIHLSLDEYFPVTEQKVFIDKGIVDEATGQFVKGRIWHVVFDETLRKAIKEEWNAQIQKIKKCDINLSHVDSHHHIHTNPALEEILIDVLEKNGIKRVRGCDYVTVSKYICGWCHFDDTNRLKELLYLLLRYPRFSNNRRWEKRMRESVKVTDDFCSVMSFLRNKSYFEKYYHDKIVELECHPGHNNYREETELLSQLTGYNRMTYNDL